MGTRLQSLMINTGCTISTCGCQGVAMGTRLQSLMINTGCTISTCGCQGVAMGTRLQSLMINTGCTISTCGCQGVAMGTRLQSLMINTGCTISTCGCQGVAMGTRLQSCCIRTCPILNQVCSVQIIFCKRTKLMLYETIMDLFKNQIGSLGVSVIDINTLTGMFCAGNCRFCPDSWLCHGVECVTIYSYLGTCPTQLWL